MSDPFGESFRVLSERGTVRGVDEVLLRARDLGTVGDAAVGDIVGARRRRARRRQAVIFLTVTVLAGAVLAARYHADGPSGLVTSGADPAVPTTVAGPLRLSWRHVEGGLSAPPLRYALDTDGTLYALTSQSPPGPTGLPGASPGGLRRLQPDGSWATIPLTGVGDINDLVAHHGRLYALTGLGGDRSRTPKLLMSPDGGRTWISTEIPAPVPPTTAVPMTPNYSMALERAGDRVVAVVSAIFAVDPRFEDGRFLTTEYREEGLVTLAETSSPAFGPPPSPEVVSVVPWSQLGVRGPEDMWRTDTRVFTPDGDRWRPVDNSGALHDLGGVSLHVLGGELVAQGVAPLSMPPDTGKRRTVASPDGQNWQLVATGSGSGRFSVGGTWVDLRSFPDSGPTDRPVLQTSTDRGATWHEVDLASIDPRLAGARPGPVTPMADGPLGLAFVVRTAGDPTEYLVATGDLRNWTVESIPALSGEPGATTMSLAVGLDRIVVTVVTADPARPDRRITMVAIPNR